VKIKQKLFQTLLNTSYYSLFSLNCLLINQIHLSLGEVTASVSHLILELHVKSKRDIWRSKMGIKERLRDVLCEHLF